MFCYECVYWNDKLGKCILTSGDCKSDRIPDKESEDEKR